MSIIHFPDSRENLVRRNNQEYPFSELERNIDKLITQTPNRVNEIINWEYVSPNEVLIVNSNDLKALILDYIIYQLNKARNTIEWWLLMSVEYISELLFKIFLFSWEEIKLIIQNPYYTHWMKRWYPKRAWDASIYSYIFRWFEWKPIKKEAYIPFAISAYLEYSKNNDFARWIWETLPLIWNISKDENFLKRWNLKTIK